MLPRGAPGSCPVAALSALWVQPGSPTLSLQAMLMVHDTVAQKNFDPVLPPLPENMEEDFEEESVKIVRLVKNKEPLVGACLSRPVVMAGGKVGFKTAAQRLALLHGAGWEGLVMSSSS